MAVAPEGPPGEGTRALRRPPGRRGAGQALVACLSGSGGYPLPRSVVKTVCADRSGSA
jgi:hypothetical protein